MKKPTSETSKTSALKRKTGQGYPLYPASEDIYNNAEETELNPENLSEHKILNEISGKSNVKEFRDDVTGDDLDVPGSELDDEQEDIGSEDEENNYYSLGGDKGD